MNILGLITVFLLLFAFLSANFSAHSRAFQRRVHEQLTQNALAKKTYQTLYTKEYARLRSLSIHPPKKSLKPLETKKKREKYKNGDYPPCAKCNLHVLLRENSPALQEVLVSIVEILCKNPTRVSLHLMNPRLFVEKFLTRIREEKQAEEAFFLEKLTWHDPSLQQQYYFLLRPLQNAPSLLDLCHTDAHQTKICLACCSEEMLCALFGASVAHKLLAQKTNPKHQLSVKKDQLEALLLEEGKTLSPEIWRMLRFSHNAKKERSHTIVAKEGERKSSVSLPKASLSSQ